MPVQLTHIFKEQDAEALHTALQQDPALANKSFTYLDQGHGPLAHPLHRLCDAVFVKALTDQKAVEMAKVLVAFGAKINGNYEAEGSTPLIAAASLHCQQLGIYLINQGADVNIVERNGEATALHWACYCGLDELVLKLIANGANIDQREPKYNCTPTEWAVQAILTQPPHVMHHQSQCIKLTLKAGADQSLFAERFKLQLIKMAETDAELKGLLK